MKSKKKTNFSLKNKLDDTPDTNLNNNLKLILDEADKITMNDLEFDHIFNEQAKILCDIKTLLQNEKTGKTSLTKCNLFQNKNDKNLKQLLNNYRQKYTSNINTITRQKEANKNTVNENVVKKEGYSQQTSKQHSKPHSKPLKHTKPIRKHTKLTRKHTKSIRKHTKSISHSKKQITRRKQKNYKELNLNYPIVFLKNKKPYKNVIMIKNTSKNKE